MRNNGLYFVIGFVFGFVVGYECAKSAGDKAKSEEVEALEEYYKGKLEEKNDPVIEKNNAIKRAEEIAKEHKYGATPAVSAFDNPSEGPYQITPELFGEFDDYEQICLKYYENGVLVDDDEVLDDIEINDAVGLGFSEHFGEYEMDAVYIRNDERRCDYEILKEIGVFVEPDSD